MEPHPLTAQIQERFDSRCRHPNPTGGELRRWLESLPFKPVSIRVTLPPRTGDPRKLHRLMWDYDVTVADGPEPAGNALKTFTVSAESAAHARHFGARLYRLQTPDHPVVFWVKATLREM